MDEKQKDKGYVLRKLFFASLYLSTFTFGGGYVIVTLLKEKFVDQYHWIDEDEMLDLVAIAQSSPGAIAVNGAIVVGYKLGGIPGMLMCVLGAIIPPMVILSLISVFYDAFRSNYYIAALWVLCLIHLCEKLLSTFHHLLLSCFDLCNLSIAKIFCICIFCKDIF